MSRVLTTLAVLVLLAPLGFVAAVNIDSDLNPLAMQPELHFWAVSLNALAALVACAVLLTTARSLRETRLLFLTLAFVSVAGIFAVHGLMTPGHLVHSFHTTIPVSAWLSITAASIWVGLSAVQFPDRVQHAIERRGAMLAAWATIAVAAYVAISFAAPDWLDGVPTDERAVQYALGLGNMALLAFAIQRYTQAYLFARLPSQATTIAALVLLFDVAAILLWGGEVWHLAWWTYHVAYLAAFVVLFGGWALEVARSRSLKAIADALSMRDALAALNRGHDAHMLQLVDAIESKDVATLGHVSRVSAYAHEIGKELGLGAQDLRALVLAAQMHDVGKIGVPDHILGKPGPLTEDETREMRLHTPRGDSIARRVAVLRPIAHVIRAHHERLDGSGYPDGLRGEAIPLLARIIGVADSYDAMTSDRPYRKGMPAAAAQTELRRVSGSELDARCVNALMTALGRQARLAA